MLDPFHATGHRRAPDPGGLISLLVSVGVHGVFAAVFITIAFLSRLHHPIPPPPPEDPPMDLVLAEPIEPPPGSTEADALAGGKAEAPAETDAPTPAPTPSPPEAAQPTEVPPTEALADTALKQELKVLKTNQVLYAVRGGTDSAASADLAPASAFPTALPTAEKSGATGSVIAAGTSPGIAHGGDGTSGEGDGGHARTAPSLAARFTKELAPYAAHVPAWETLPVGQTASVEVTLELDAAGHVVRDRDPVAGITDAPESIVESVRRTQKSLLLVFSLPDHPVGAGTVTLRMRADVSDRPPPSPSASLDPNGIEYAFTFEGKTGTATFTLASGRHVELTVEVVRVEPN